MRMKIGVLLFLVVGPFAARAQLMSRDRVPADPASGWLRSNKQFLGWQPSSVVLPGTGGRLQTPLVDLALISLLQRDSLRILLPDRMPCLVPLRVSDAMVRRMRFCGVEKMPNALRP
jgi:hypothetical protein